MQGEGNQEGNRCLRPKAAVPPILPAPANQRKRGKATTEPTSRQRRRDDGAATTWRRRCSDGEDRVRMAERGERIEARTDDDGRRHGVRIEVRIGGRIEERHGDDSAGTMAR